MTQYRKKPIVIEAVQWNGSGFALNELPEWFRQAFMSRAIDRNGDKLTVVTLEGIHTADAGDWIIRGVEGEIYPCKPSVFEKTYDPVSS